ncbi:hypothetical protein M514_08925 [Trichuris suis]|uniref:Uncharacterized protein n=1 Tax=Trichuris suis TaxID=68888 RepID=A0A085LYY4_9BILA|nr:hypothetical protein M513_08925 [Trichuris suis]KFD70421.1 hypothetical protein M514_08925 [Trichuris suis]
MIDRRGLTNFTPQFQLCIDDCKAHLEKINANGMRRFLALSGEQQYFLGEELNASLSRLLLPSRLFRKVFPAAT